MAENEIVEGIRVKIGRNRTIVTDSRNMVFTVRKKKARSRDPTRPGKYAEANYAKRKKKRAEIVREACYNSLAVNGAVFITLTFSPKQYPGKDLTDIKVTHAEFKRFIKRMNDHYDNFKYVATFAQQTNKNWHYHMLCNLDVNTTEETISGIWKNGLIQLSPITSDAGFKKKINYLISNMRQSADALKGKKGYLRSRNTECDFVVTSWRLEQQAEFNAVACKIMEGTAYKMYETEKHLGIKGETLKIDTGEICDRFIPDMEITDELRENGYEDCTTTHQYYAASVRFEEKFMPLVTATPKKKKFKHGKKTK